MREERPKLSRGSDVAKAMDYMLKRWIAFTRFLDDGRICLSNNAAERALRGIALGRKSWLFAGSDRGGERAAVMYTLIQTCRLNNVDPQAWLADVLGRINATISGTWISYFHGTGRRTPQASLHNHQCQVPRAGFCPSTPAVYTGRIRRASIPFSTETLSIT